MKIVLQTLLTFVIGAAVLGLILFVSAGTFDYWQAWAFIAVFMASVCFIGVYLTLTNPALLERRKQIGPAAEQSPVQKAIISMGLLGNLGLLVVCGLDRRFGWSAMPSVVSIVGDVLIAAGLGVDLLVFRENSYGASNVKVEAEQTVTTTGPYAVVRHPMYLGVLIMILGVPLALGSWWGLAILAVLLPGLMYRILVEEKLLHKDLAGYSEYAQKVKYRLVPYIW